MEKLLSQRIRESKSLDFGEVFNESIALFKEAWVYGLVQALVLFCAMMVIVPLLFTIFLIPLLVTLGLSSQVDESMMSMVTIIGGVGGNILSSLLSIIFLTVLFSINAGFYLILKQIDEGKKPEMGSFFFLLKRKYLMKTCVISLITILLVIVSIMLCVIPFLYMLPVFSKIWTIYVFNPELSISSIVNLGFKAANKHWGMLFLIMLVSTLLLNALGSITCGLGFLASSFILVNNYITHKKVVGFTSDNDDIELIGNNNNLKL